MLRIVGEEWLLDSKGAPVKVFCYLVSDKSELPENAPVGSRAVCTAGKGYFKTPSGWSI